MRIRVQDQDTNLRLRFPTGLLLNRLTVCILWQVFRKKIREKGIPITRKGMLELMKIAKSYRKRHPGWVLVEVDSQDGDHVRVML